MKSKLEAPSKAHHQITLNQEKKSSIDIGEIRKKNFSMQITPRLVPNMQLGIFKRKEKLWFQMLKEMIANITFKHPPVQQMSLILQLVSLLLVAMWHQELQQPRFDLCVATKD